jgi:hypothetical protein
MRDLTSTRAQLVLGLSVSVLLSCGVGNVLLAVTESVLWPLIAGVVWVVCAFLVVIEAEAATRSRWRTRPSDLVRRTAATPARHG